ncbi:PAS domain S-box protein [Laspinema olomoucense]|uniref:PAS domain S-box protein n=1 Tax=Laspinema olomoucense TaxID=3231600 RepID=UPI0021BAB9E3|nr:PAS domain S-box protein [Laspinema sp. D3a]MCT7991221.1 PAS domain S-box protein [Laspinema sp. D3a]
MVTRSQLVALQKEYAELQNRLQESETLFQISFSQAPVGMVQCGLDGQIWKANQKFCEIVGYTGEELRSRSFEDLTHPEDLNVELVWARKLVNAEIDTYSLQKRYLRKDGAIARVSLRVDLVRDGKGLAHSVMGFITEITHAQGRIDPIKDEVRQEKAERERAEAALHEYEARFERLAKTLPGMVYQYRQYLNPTYDIFTYISPACREIYELEPEAVLNNCQLMWQTIHPEDSPGFAHSFICAAQTGKEWRYQWRIITASGQLKWLQGAAKMSPQPDGAMLWDGMVLDITDRKLVDDSMRQQIEMLDQANDSILIRDLNDYIQYWNQGAERLYGWSLTEVKGQYIHEFLQTSFPEPLPKIMTSFLRDGHWRGELVHTKRDGTQVVVDSRWSLQRDEQNHPRAILEINTDISDRKQAELALKNSEARFRTTFEQAAVGVAHVDFQGRFIRINQRFCDIVGYSKAEMLTLTFQEITHSEDLDLDWELAQQVKREQITHYSIEKRYIRKDNTWIWVNLTVAMEQDGSYWISVVEDISDRKKAEAARLQSEAQLREKVEREELLNRLTSQIRNSLDLDRILETVVSELQRVLNLDRCYFLWHQTEPISVWSCIQEAKRPTLDRFLGEYPIPENSFLYRRLIEGEIVWCDDLAQSPDLDWHTVYLEYGFRAILLVPLRKSNGKLGVICCANSGETRPWKLSEIHLLEAVRDCMEIAIFQAELYKEATARSQELEQTLKKLQKTQTQLIQSEKMAGLGQLVAGIAHEINNPVSFIFGNIIHARDYLSDLLAVVELYDQHYPNPGPEILDKANEVDLEFLKEDFSKLLDSMEQGAIRIREIVTSLRTFSRYDEAALKDVDIHSGIESSLMILKNRLDSQGNRPEIELIRNYGTLPMVECFASELNQVFINILTNAIDAIDEAYSRQSNRQEPGKIWIQTQVLPGDRIAIQIKDNGCGISEDSLARLFDPFFTTKPIGKGTGLGLATSYQIAVDRHKGGLQCTSTPGIGSEFTIELPIHQDQFHKDEKR